MNSIFDKQSFAHHQYFFSEGTWSGAGTIIAIENSMSLHFTMTKKIIFSEEGKLQINQQVEVVENKQVWQTDITISNCIDSQFEVNIETPKVGKLVGTGLVTEKDIGWTAYETPEKKLGITLLTYLGNGSYLTNSSYLTQENLKISISGIISKTS
ncbi:MAG: hypothetical protein VX777_01415 [Chlamydiota bacterium]|nr:hypothetical protein [Chlamydiota bacterium]